MTAVAVYVTVRCAVHVTVGRTAAVALALLALLSLIAVSVLGGVDEQAPRRVQGRRFVPIKQTSKTPMWWLSVRHVQYKHVTCSSVSNNMFIFSLFSPLYQVGSSLPCIVSQIPPPNMYVGQYAMWCS